MERRSSPGRLRGFVRRPTAAEFQGIAADHDIILTDAEAEEVAEAAAGMLGAVDRIDDLPVPSIPVRYTQRNPGRRPTSQEDPYNAFIRLCEVKGAPSGPLAGKRVGIKDNIKVAGVPMTNGSRLHRDYVPDHDATVVERLLDAGATIVGKLNMDDFSWSGTGETSTFGPTQNPRNPAFSPGGSSSGSGSAVASGHVDMAIGADQAGSVRIPASWCGVVGIKATHGLIPTFGATYMDHTIDFLGPLAPSVADAALMLEAIAGEDPRDPQWVRGSIRTETYTKALTGDIAGLRVGVVREGFDWGFAERDVVDSVRAAIAKLESLGAIISDVSIPWWPDAWPIEATLLSHSVSATIDSGGEGFSRGGYADPAFQQALGKGLRSASGHDLAPFFLVSYVVGKYLRRDYFSAYWGKAQNLRMALRQQVDDVFAHVDVLVTPTTAIKPSRLLDEPLTLRALGEKGSSNTHNTCIFNLTGHPALSVPCGTGADSLPIGLQVAGRHWEESTILRVAHAFEQA
jgi:amidase